MTSVTSLSTRSIRAVYSSSTKTGMEAAGRLPQIAGRREVHQPRARRGGQRRRRPIWLTLTLLVPRTHPMQWRQAVGEVKSRVGLLGELDRVVRLISFVEGFRFYVERLGVVHAYIRARAREALGVRRPGVAVSAPDKSKDVVGKIALRSFPHQAEQGPSAL